jgi:hypothetical protein
MKYAGLVLDLEEPAIGQSTFREVHVIWILAGLNTLYVIANLLFIRLDKESNHGNVEHAKLHDIKEGYKALERQSTGEDVDLSSLPINLTQSKVHLWRVRLYIFLVALVLVITWISFGVVMGYRSS